MQPSFDATWHRLALRGDERAVARLADEALAPLFRFCLYRVGGRRDLCEEVVQETLVRAIRELERYDPARAQGDVLPWLTGLARNEVRRVLASERPGERLTAAWERIDDELQAVFARLGEEPLADEHLEREETRLLVNATMSQLPTHYREALEAKYVLGHSVRRLADGLGVSEKAVESRLTRAREAFRETFRALARGPVEEAI